MNMSSVPVDVVPTYAAYAGGPAPEDMAVDVVGVGGVHAGAGAATTGLATGGSATGEGWAVGVTVTCCMGMR